VVFPEVFQGFDPNIASSVEFPVLEHVAQQLIDWDPKTGEPYGILAESWNWVNPTTLEIKLRPNVKFSNGEPLNSAAVKYSLDRTVDPEVTQHQKSAGRQNARYSQLGLTGIETPDELTVRLVGKSFNPFFMSRLMDDTVVVAPATKGIHPDEVNKGKLIGTGPFTVASYTRETGEVHLKANPNYWGEGPFVEEVVIRSVPEPSIRAAEIEAGSADIAYDLPADAKARLPKTQVFISPRKRYIMMRTIDNVFADVRVRQAMLYATNRSSYVNQILEGNGQVMTWITQPPARDPNLQPYPYDQAKARQLLADAGYANGFDETLAYISGDPKLDEIMQAIRSDLAAVGVRITLRPTERSILIKQMADNDPALHFSYNDGGFNDDGARAIDSVIGQGFGMTAYGGWCRDDRGPGLGLKCTSVPELEQLWAAQKTQTDPTQRLATVRRMERITYDAAIIVPLYHPGIIVGYGPKYADGFVYSVNSQWNANGVRLNP
jgi:peptide/nickel transport system substrate-binding protein